MYVEIQDNCGLKLHYQLDGYDVLPVRVVDTPAIVSTFVRVDHGCGEWPFLPFILCMQ